MKVKAIKVNKDDRTIDLIDQRYLPVKVQNIKAVSMDDCFTAIKEMVVRGAPAIGITAAFGAFFAYKEASDDKQFQDSLKHLKEARPTAVNLRWAVDNISEMVKSLISRGKKSSQIEDVLWDNACRVLEEDIRTNEAIGTHGARLVKSGMNILTHCNAGALATGGYGTALGVVRKAHEVYGNIHVYVDETRPYLQGARLTVFEMHEEKIPYTLICDSMAGFFMSQKKVDFIVVGADRVAMNGDTANKIGTYSLSILAKYHNIPFYIAAPFSTFDKSTESGKDIPIEFRRGCEVIKIGEQNITFTDCHVENPSFDVTPSDLITGIITEKGVIRAPYAENIKEWLG